jgi:hypothetical protein
MIAVALVELFSRSAPSRPNAHRALVVCSGTLTGSLGHARVRRQFGKVKEIDAYVICLRHIGTNAVS